MRRFRRIELSAPGALPDGRDGVNVKPPGDASHVCSENVIKGQSLKQHFDTCLIFAAIRGDGELAADVRRALKRAAKQINCGVIPTNGPDLRLLCRRGKKKKTVSK